MRLTATLIDGTGKPLAFEDVVLLRQDIGATALVEVTRSFTGSPGVAAWDVVASATATFLARYVPIAGSGFAAANSAPVTVRVMFAVSAEV